MAMRCGETPVPIPNTTVKPAAADGTALETVWESRWLPEFSSFCLFHYFHNHPSGSLQPSQEDRDVTRRLLECGDLLNIRMMDHIIVAGESARIYSFKEHGELDMLKPRRREWER